MKDVAGRPTTSLSDRRTDRHGRRGEGVARNDVRRTRGRFDESPVGWR